MGAVRDTLAWLLRTSTAQVALRLVMGMALLLPLASCSQGASSTAGSHVLGASAAVKGTSAVPFFDPSVGAPLPDSRIVAAYGIVGGGQHNGPASTLDLLNAFLPQFQQLGQQ